MLATAVLGALVALASAGGSSGAPAQAMPVITIEDVSVVEGNAGTTNAVFTVRSNIPAPDNYLVFTAVTQNATATSPTDFTMLAQGFRIDLGQTSATFSVAVHGDTEIEFDETFNVTLSIGSNATCSRCFAQGTIEDDDTPPPPKIVFCRCERVQAELAGVKARGRAGGAELWDVAVKGAMRCRGGNTADCEGFVRTVSPPTLATQTPKPFACEGECGQRAARFGLAIRIRIGRAEIAAARERWRTAGTPLRKTVRIRQGCRGTRGAVRTFTLAFTNGNRFSAALSDLDGDGKPGRR